MYVQTRNSGGFSLTFHNHRLHGRDGYDYLPATAQGHVWIEAFHNQNRRGFCFALYYHPSKWGCCTKLSLIIIIVVVHPRLFPFFHFPDGQGCPHTSTNSHSWSGQRRVIHAEGRESTRNYTFCGLTPLTEFLSIMRRANPPTDQTNPPAFNYYF